MLLGLLVACRLYCSGCFAGLRSPAPTCLGAGRRPSWGNSRLGIGIGGLRRRLRELRWAA